MLVNIVYTINSLQLLITCANSSDPVQNVRPDLDSNILTLSEFFEKVDVEKNQQITKSIQRQHFAYWVIFVGFFVLC